MLEDEAHHRLISYILLIVSLILIKAWPIAAVTNNDKIVLLELKLFLQNNNRVTRGRYSHWNESNPDPCSWFGISCNPSERVTGINLAGSSISGGIFGNFSGLSDLLHLDLSQNTISGPIPPDLNQCRGLRYLNLSHNLIDGELNLTGLSRLETLDLTLNRFTGVICANFPAMCQNLVTLNLSMNNFSGEITGCFDGCPNLRYLDLSSNGIVGVLRNGFSGLREFYVSDNYLTGVFQPDTFGSNCSLEVLDISSNSLGGAVPDSISNCKKLRFLNLWGNKFVGRIPSAMGLLPELDTLFLGNNSFQPEIPKQLLNCTKLVFIDLSRNNFGGEVQEIFGRFRTLKFLILHSNSYTRGIETSGILNLPNLTRLDLSFNNFSGELPLEIPNMPSLKYLILAYNNFSGRIPPEYGNFAGLQALDVSFNQLTGSIPPSIGNLTSLLWLMLANNRITGEIPPEIGNCTSLLWLNLANNQISGSIPSSLTQIGRNPDPTFQLNRRETGMSAGSGECLAMLRWLPASYPPFNFVYTLLTRKKCRSIWDQLLKGIGIFPVCANSSSIFRTLDISGYLQLSGNLLSGEIPPEIGMMKNLSLLHLDRNRLSGMPPEIGQLRLVVFNVSNNSFSGKIPQELGKLRCLSSLDLSLNNFSGEFQTSLSGLTELEKFNISYNPLLSGVVPVTGQLSTFDDDSFIGDPLIHRYSLPENSDIPPVADPQTESTRTVLFRVFVVLTVVFFTCGVISFVVSFSNRSKVDDDPGDLLLRKRRIDNYDSSTSTATMSKVEKASSRRSQSSSTSVKVFHMDKMTAFTYADILASTGNFSEEMVVGKGGFGVVYRGVLPDGRRVAVKKMQRGRRGEEEDEEGEREFRAEMEVLSGRGPHPNLATLFGWCLSGSEKVLVYEYMSGGSLEEAVGDWPGFGWRRRVEAAVGVARALAFLHHECQPAVVHRDVKASNVLMDGEGRARVTDFGLARVVGPGESHVSTAVAGTVGYVAPEYGHTWRATTRGDVYSFGVLAMELATGRRAVEGGESLVDWARRRAEGGTDTVTAKWKKKKKNGEVEMRALLRVGLLCTADAPQARPDMNQVLAVLLRISGGGGSRDGNSGSCSSSPSQ